MSETSSTRFPRRRSWWLLVAAIALLYTCALGSRGLNEPDEGRYAAIALAMTQPGGDWWEPRMSGWGHYDKPPLIYWATAACFRCLGVNEWAARLPSLLGAWLALAGLGWAAFRLRGARTAWWAVLVCATCEQFWLLGRVLSPDMLLCAWCTLAVAAWAECRHRAGAWRWWLLSLLCWTLAWWTKATPALIPLAGLAAGVWITKDREGWRALRLPLLLPSLLVLGSPWYLSMLARYPELRSFFFGRELAGRMAGSVNGRKASLFYYVPVSLALWLPWWPVAAWCSWRGWKISTTSVRDCVRRVGVEGWLAAIGFVLFSLAASKLPTYILPLMPWVSLLMARAIVHRLDSRGESFGLRFLFPVALFVVVPCVMIFGVPKYETELGTNSSLRRICRFLEEHSARRVDADHYWPGMEFYLPHSALYYVVRDDAANTRKDAAKGLVKFRDERFRERASDTGIPPNRFSEITPWPALPQDDPRGPILENGEIYFVRFVRQKDSPFHACIRRGAGQNPPELMLMDGDFRVYRTVLQNGALLPPTPPSSEP